MAISRFLPSRNSRTSARYARLQVEMLENRELLDAGAAQAVTAGNPYNTQFINNLYQDLLNRTPSQDELSYWQNALNSGVSRQQAASNFLNSPEYARKQIQSDYNQILGRNPTLSESNTWLSQMNGGETNEQIQAALLNSDEFYQDEGSNSATWLIGVYHVAMGRDPDIAGLSYWYQQLQSGASRPQIVQNILGSPEAQAHVVSTDFQTLLNRQPDAAGLKWYTQAMSQGLTQTNLTLLIVSSTEFFDRQVLTVQQPVRLELSGADETSVVGTVITSDDPHDVSNQPDLNHAEMSIAVNPTNANNIVIASHSFGVGPVFIDVYVSMDGGKTFSVHRMDQSVDGVAADFRFDPNVVFDSQGRLYVSYGIDTAPGSEDQGTSYVIVNRSTDGGRTFQSAIVRQDNKSVVSDDKFLMTTGPAPGNPAQQNVYIAWTQFPAAGGSVIVISGSVNGGVSWSGAVQVSNTSSTQIACPAVGPQGQIYVSFEEGNGIAVNVSNTFNGTAGSFSFGTDRFAVPQLNSPQPTPAYIPAQPGRGITNMPVLGVDRSGGVYDGKLYLAYTDTAPGQTSPNFDIWVVTSSDGGNTWSAPTRINDDGVLGSHFNPWLSIDQSDGFVSLSWRDSRQDPTDEKVNVYSTTSVNGGASWSANQQVSSAPSDEAANNTQGVDNNYLEYDGLDAINGSLYYAWSDNSLDPNGIKQVYFTVLPGGGFARFVDQFDSNETSDRAANLGTLAFGAQELFTQLSIATHPNGLPDYDWYRFAPASNGTFTATIGSSTGDLELWLYTVDQNNTLVLLSNDVTPGQATRTVSAAVQQGEPMLVEVKGRDLSLGVWGTGPYKMNVSLR